MIIEIFTKIKPIRISIIYRPPYTNFNNTRLLLKLIQKHTSQHFILNGDFNLNNNHLVWSVSPASYCSKIGELFLDYCSKNCLQLFTPGPTRSGSWLDLSLANFAGIDNSTIINGLDNSDHDTTLFTLDIPFSPSKPKYTSNRNFNNINSYRDRGAN